MPQLHVYVPDALAQEVRRRADARGLSISRYLAQLLRRDVGGDWPEAWFENVVGGWQGKALERPPQEAFETRDEIR